ncbi:predicted protein [Nematostella vectensis]|uniref:P2X purinoreceptor 7 intracellular domain-containing protein n=1 Tax=Nematostella vectensis TaxID=45351 RepID=A7RUP4_NEMVE|nr:predicted protein [Nematostella vectensis]|eukprot:XP_001636796.1 predicted protein [Nematostella vectensis]
MEESIEEEIERRTPDRQSVQARTSCNCKSTCSRKRVEDGARARGCPCKGANKHCNSSCKCGTRSKPCQNKESTTREVHSTYGPGPRTTRKSEEEEMKEANRQVKEFIDTLDFETIKSLCVKSLQRGVGSMDFIDSLLVMEDDDNDREEENLGLAMEPMDVAGPSTHPQGPTAVGITPATRPPGEALPDWCKCGNCREMPQQIENVWCGKRNCESTKAKFGKLCLDVEVLSLGIRSSADIRNDWHDSSARAFRKAGYRNYILDKHGYLGKRKRRVAPSCIVWQIRHHYPTRTGIYMGFREN